VSELWITFAVMALLLLAKGFFSGSEIAMVSADRVRLRARAARGASGSKLAMRLMRDPARLLTTTLLGTNMVSIALTTMGTLAMVRLFGAQGELVAVLVFTPLFLILGEIVPKSVYQQKADVAAPLISHPLAWLQTVLSPLVWLFSSVAKLAARLIGGVEDPAAAARDQVVATVLMAEKTGASAAFERGQVRGVLRVAQMRAGEIVWPLDDLTCAPRAAGMAKIVAARRAGGRRLVPLYRRHPRDIDAIAVIDSWDLLDPELESRPVSSVLGPMLFASEHQRVAEIIDLLARDPTATVVVLDDRGAAQGLITLPPLVRRTLGAEAEIEAPRDA
jgi:putative hemolysin